VPPPGTPLGPNRLLDRRFEASLAALDSRTGAVEPLGQMFERVLRFAHDLRHPAEKDVGLAGEWRVPQSCANLASHRSSMEIVNG
jgi:hypothetical protein